MPGTRSAAVRCGVARSVRRRALERGSGTRATALSVGPVTVGHMTTRIDCDTCVVRGLACHDCVVTVLLGPPPELAFDEEDRELLGALAAGGLVPPLRLVTPTGSSPEGEEPGAATA